MFFKITKGHAYDWFYCTKEVVLLITCTTLSLTSNLIWYILLCLISIMCIIYIGQTICEKVCHNGGTCVNGSQCSCSLEWTGITCETGTYCVSIVVLKDIACTILLILTTT